jgi:hypothetical protein
VKTSNLTWLETVYISCSLMNLLRGPRTEQLTLAVWVSGVTWHPGPVPQSGHGRFIAWNFRFFSSAHHCSVESLATGSVVKQRMQHTYEPGCFHRATSGSPTEPDGWYIRLFLSARVSLQMAAKQCTWHAVPLWYAKYASNRKAAGAKPDQTQQNKLTPWPLVRKRTIPTERSPLVGEI